MSVSRLCCVFKICLVYTPVKHSPLIKSQSKYCKKLNINTLAIYTPKSNRLYMGQCFEILENAEYN